MVLLSFFSVATFCCCQSFPINQWEAFKGPAVCPSNIKEAVLDKMGCSIEELLAAADLLRACQERLLYLDFYARLSYAEVFGSFTFLWQKRKILQTRKCSCTTLALDAMTGQYILWCYHFICQIVILVLQKLLPWLMKLCIQKIKEQ